MPPLLRRLRREIAVRVRPRTALIIPVPAAGPLLARWSETASAGNDGLGPHVTVLYPFLPAREIREGVERELAAIARRVSAFDFALARLDAFPGVHYLAPEPDEPFIRLTEHVAARWPQRPPYGGRFVAIVPHLTVAIGNPPAPLADLHEHLPLPSRATALQLAQQGPRGWRIRGSWPLG